MKRSPWATRCAAVTVVVVLGLATLRADVSFTQVSTIEGGVAASLGSANKPMTMTTRVKGTKSRIDIDVVDTKVSGIVDLEAKQVTLLNHADKTAQVLSTTAPLPASPDAPMPTINASVKATGQTRTIEGVATDEHVLTMTISVSEMSGGQMPPEVQQMLKDVRFAITGSLWLAKTGPGAEEYLAFQKGAANLSSVLAGVVMGPSKGVGGLDKLFSALADAPGVPYLTEVTMSIDGTGPLVDMLKQQISGLKLVQKTTSVSTDTLPDDLFKVPADYTMKQ